MCTKQFVFCLTLVLTANAVQGRDVSQSQIPALTPASVGASIAAMPLPFTKNEGQWPDSILFRTSAGGATMWFTKNGIYYQFFKKIEKTNATATAIDPVQDALGAMPDKFDNERDSIETTMIKAEFVGASESVEVVGLEELEYKCNYFIGNVPSKWRSDVPNFSAVTMRGLYPGVDVTFSTKDGRFQEELTASTSGELSQVQIAYHGADGATQQTDNLVVVKTPFGERLFEGILLSNGQESSLSETPSSATAISSASSVTLIYSTYLGGGGSQDIGSAIAVDTSGNCFVSGSTNSTNFPTLNPYQIDQSGNDAFVTKLSSTGSALIYSTYLGGGFADYGHGIAVNANGNAFVTGYTISSDFPTLNPYQTDQGGDDVFVTKLSPSGGALIYSTYVGGAGSDIGNGIAINASGHAFVTGYSGSTNFPTLNPYQIDQSGNDVFVTRLSTSGSVLMYSTYLGGGGDDLGLGITVDANNSAFVTGQTTSADFPTVNSYQGSIQGNYDVFVTKLSSSGSALNYSTYLGGGTTDVGKGIAIDATGNAFVAGFTLSNDFPTLNPFQVSRQGNYDAFVSKLSSSGGSLIYSTYLGGGAADYGNGIAIDASGDVFVTGATYSSDFPTLNPYQTDQVAGDVFVTKLNSFGSALIYSTYLGGGSDDIGYGIAAYGGGNAFVTGYTSSPDFPAMSAYQATAQAFNEAFVTKLDGDSDGDGEPNATDNCPFSYNPLQEDFDNDGQGDSCFMPNYLSPLTIVARYAAPSPPSPPNPPGDPNVNLRIIDPTGLTIGADSVGSITNSIGGSANYFQIAGNDSIVIVDPKSGEYAIEVIPEADANPGDKYLVGIRIDGTVELVDPDKLVPNQGERDTVFVNNIPYAFGDGDGDRNVSIGDAVFIIGYIFLAGAPPVPVVAADSDCDGAVTIGDAVHLIGYIFLGGSAPGCGP